MTDDERHASERLNEECAKYEQVYRDALDELNAIALDFDGESQQAFMLAMRAVSDARDNLWYAMHRDDEVAP